MKKNVSGQKWRVYAYDAETGAAKTGDASNITAYITKDYGTPGATNDTNPSEVSSTNEPGYYDFDLTQAETNGDVMTLSPKSSTSGVNVIACPPVIWTRPANLSALGIDSSGNLTGSIGSLGTQAKADVNAEVDAALADYDPPTNAEMEARTLAAASYATASALATVDSNVDAILVDTDTTIPGLIGTVDGVVDAIKAVTDNLPDSGALTSLATASALSTVDGVVDAIKTVTDKLDDTLEDQGSGTYGFTEAALQEAPTGAGSGATAQEVWEYATRTLTTIDEDSTTLDLDATIRAAVGMSSANLDTQLGTIDSNVDSILDDTGTSGVVVASIANGAITANAIASNAITADKVASDAVSEIQSGLATASALATVDSVVDAIKVTTDKLDDTLEDDGGTYRFTQNALEQAPSGGEGGTSDWTADEKTAIRAILGIPSSGTTPDDPSSGILDTIRDAIGVVDGNVDAILEDTGTTLPSTLSSITSAISTIDGIVDEILVDTGTTLPGTLSTIAGYIDTEIASLISAVGTVDGVVDAIKAVTDNLPDSGALTSLATASALATVDNIVDAILEDTGTTLPGTLSTLTGYVDTEVAAIKAVTDKLDDTLEDDGGTYRFTENALEQAPSGGGSSSFDPSGSVPAEPSAGTYDKAFSLILNHVDTDISSVSSSAGAGAVEYEVTIRTTGQSPIANAEVWITTDQAGSNIVAGRLFTDAFGKCTFHLDEGSYYMWVQKPGVNFSNPSEITVEE